MVDNRDELKEKLKEKLREILSKNMQKNFGKVRVESIRLKKSELRKEGPLYTTLLDVKL